MTSTKNLVWIGDSIAEERDASNAVTRRFYGQGEQIGGTAYFYAKDHLGSIREMTDTSGAIRARYTYDPYGGRTKVSGDLDATFGFTGHYYHARSGLHLAEYRAYDASLGRWISRDPLENAEIEEGPNLYAYVRNNSINLIDPLGLLDFATLWQNYPTPQTYPTSNPAPGQQTIWDKIGGKVAENGFTNSCAVRMSDALNASGVKIPFEKGKTVSGANGEWYYFRVADHQKYLNGILGAPLQFTPQNWKAGVGGQTGIVNFQNNWSDATGHFDLYNGSATIDGHDYSTQANCEGVQVYLVK